MAAIYIQLQIIVQCNEIRKFLHNLQNQKFISTEKIYSTPDHK